jgi:hypothetical protein
MHELLLPYPTRRDNLGIMELFPLSAIRFTSPIKKKRCLLQHRLVDLHEMSTTASFDSVRNFLVFVWLFLE